jgi:uncharacterized spore protein YtfJ
VTDPLEEAKHEAEAAAAGNRFAKLVETLGGTAAAKAVFGEPVERDGVTVVPVATVRYGVGGGGGRGPGRRRRGGEEAEQVGYGQGGGLQAAPVGYIEIRDGQASYTRISDPARILLIAPLLPLAVALSVTLIIAFGRRSLAAGAGGSLDS